MFTFMTLCYFALAVFLLDELFCWAEREPNPSKWAAALAADVEWAAYKEQHGWKGD